jgi:hypothetical protein
MNVKEWEGYLRRNIVIVAARIASGELQIDALDKEHILGIDVAEVDRLIAEGKLPPWDLESNRLTLRVSPTQGVAARRGLGSSRARS